MDRPDTMRVMLLAEQGEALLNTRLPVPCPGQGQVLVRVKACGVCRTDLHIMDGDLTEPKLPLVLGHEIVGEVVEIGEGAFGLAPGQRVGIPWLGWSCGACTFCQNEQENLCRQARYTGYQIDGGFAEYTVADARYCFPMPDGYSDVKAAPLLCAGLIGYRSYCMCGDEVKRLGLYGFGASAHIIAQIAVHDKMAVYAFTRPLDETKQKFAHTLGAVWAGGSDELPPEPLDAAIIFAPVGDLVPAALQAVRPGGVVVCAGIHMSDIPSFPYSLLWEEKVVRSVANLTRRDGEELLLLAPNVPLRTSVQTYPLWQANEAFDDLRQGKLTGAAVLIP